MSIFECLKDYENKHGKLSKKNTQVHDSILARKEMFKKMCCGNCTTNEKKSKGENF